MISESELYEMIRISREEIKKTKSDLNGALEDCDWRYAHEFAECLAGLITELIVMEEMAKDDDPR